jgi:hypothetical protein
MRSAPIGIETGDGSLIGGSPLNAPRSPQFGATTRNLFHVHTSKQPNATGGPRRFQLAPLVHRRYASRRNSDDFRDISFG